MLKILFVAASDSEYGMMTSMCLEHAMRTPGNINYRTFDTLALEHVSWHFTVIDKSCMEDMARIMPDQMILSSNIRGAEREKLLETALNGKHSPIHGIAVLGFSPDIIIKMPPDGPVSIERML